MRDQNFDACKRRCIDYICRNRQRRRMGLSHSCQNPTHERSKNMRTNKKYRFLLPALLPILALLVISVIFLTTAEAPEPSVSIEKFNLTFESNIYIKYAVKAENTGTVTEDNFKLLIWDQPQASYAKGSEKAALTSLGKQTISGEVYHIFAYEDLAAKQMADDIYARVWYESNGTAYYSDVEKYSILQYAYNKLGITGTASTDEDFKAMLRNMLEYGAYAQKYFDYNTDRLANKGFSQITVQGGLLSDGNTAGLFVVGSNITITAPATNAEGAPFAGWKNADGIIFSTDSTTTIAVGTANATYTAFYGSSGPATPDDYFLFTLLDDDTYSISVYDPWALPADLVIPTTHNGKYITHIEENAFIDCADLVSVTIPESVTSIGECAFAGCSSLKSITLPFIGAAKDAVDDMHFGYIFSSSSNSESYKYVPATLDTVVITDGTSIGYRAFFGCSNIKVIKLPDTLTIIGQDAFYGCTKLTDCIIPDSVTFIDDGAFNNCDSLRSVVIPDGVTTIEPYLFYDCDSLVSVTLPAGITSIGNNAFESASSLRDITLPESLTFIGNRAFYDCDRLTSITIPDKVTTIGIDAFRGCDNITTVTIGNSVETIGDYAFYWCHNLQTVTIGNRVKTIGNYAFYDCGEMTTLTLGNSVETIGDSAFSSCDKLTTLVIPDSVTRIGVSAFQNCTGLTSISIGSGVALIWENAFASCHGIIQVENGVSYVDKWVVGCDSSATSVSLRADTVGIVDCAFRDRTNLVRVVLPDGIQYIGDYAFRNCSALTTLKVPDSVKRIGVYAFYDCKALRTAIIGNGVTSIGERAFYNCTALEKITLGNSIESIGSYAFYDCDALTEVVLPDSLTSIADYLFANCSALQNVTVGDSVTHIGTHAFYSCKSLRSITLPKSLTSIASHLFGGHYDIPAIYLSTVYYAGTPGEWAAISIGPDYNTPLTNATIYYYSETAPDDTQHSYWHSVDGVPTPW